MNMKNLDIFLYCNIMIVYMVEEKFANFREKLDVYVHLREGDKLMRNGSTMYSEPPGFFQSWKRWWYKENQETTFQYLDEDFTEFMKFEIELKFLGVCLKSLYAVFIFLLIICKKILSIYGSLQ